jgi:hypothetical protein
MANLQSPRKSVTVQLPAELLAELQRLAQEKNWSLDDLVTEACAAYAEPYGWERHYKEWLQAHPAEARREFGIDGDDLAAPPGSGEGRR